MRPIAALGTVLLATAGMLCAARYVHAADLDPAYAGPPAYAEPDAQYEFGTGWYLRGDASFADDGQPRLTANGFTNTKQDWNYVVGGGVGYKFNAFLRVDITGDYFEGRSYTGAAVDPVSGLAAVNANGDPIYNKASLERYDGLANLYVDLGTWYGLTPYVGGGAGFAIYNPSEQLAVAKTGPYLSDRTSSATRFAWAAMAGVSYQFDQNIAVDLGYRHVDLGRFSTNLVGYTIDHHYTQDEVRIGFRYMIF